jgi:hypothetical protein
LQEALDRRLQRGYFRQEASDNMFLRRFRQETSEKRL